MNSIDASNAITFSLDLEEGIEGKYREEIRWLFEYIEFLGVAVLKDEQPLSVAQIYVSIPFSRRPTSLNDRYDEKDRGEKRLGIIDALTDNPHLVVLGDPGSGKSTLIRLLVQSFARTEHTPLARSFGPRLPIPIILRDYQVGKWNSPEDMLAAFLERLPAAVKPSGVSVDWLLASLDQGRAILLLDGLDEVGSKIARTRLIDKVFAPLFSRCTESIILVTSRMVGYEEAPLVFTRSIPSDGTDRAVVTDRIPSWYLAPFGEDEKDEFIRRWYIARERDEHERTRLMDTLRVAVRRNDRIRRLAGNPSLLTIMALINRVQANLPSGRARLYEKIAETYLETLDRYRGLQGFGASVEEMRRWLARVGYEMQQRRDNKDKITEILAKSDEIREWLQEEMTGSRTHPERDAARFLDFVKRRSGLLIERGPDMFAWVHLSFQEYFAALHIFGKLWDRDFFYSECTKRAQERHWHETLVLLFELLRAIFPGASQDLLDVLRNRTDSNKLFPLSLLILELVDDEDTGITAERSLPFVLQAACEHTQLFPMLVRKYSRTIVTSQLHDLLLNQSEKNLSIEAQFNIAYYFGKDRSICRWAVESSSIPLANWLYINPNSEEGKPPLIDHLQAPLVNDRKASQRFLFLSSLSLSYATGRSLLMPLVTLFFSMNPTNAHDLNKALNLCQVFARAKHRIEATGSYAPHFEPHIFWGQSPANGRAIAAYIIKVAALDHARANAVQAIQGYLRSAIRLLGFTIDRSTKDGRTQFLPDLALDNATPLLFDPPSTTSKFNSSVVESLHEQRSAKDHWTRLQALTELLLRGEGTSYLCQERNDLLDFGMTQSRDFIYPESLGQLIEPKELIRILRCVHLHEPGAPFLHPEWYEKEHAYAPFMRANAEEFASLAAEYLFFPKDSEIWKTYKTRAEVEENQMQRWAQIDQT